MATDQERELMKFCDGLFRQAYNAQKDRQEALLRNWEYFEGKQWSTPSSVPMRDRVTFNLFRNIILQSVAHQTTAKPSVRVEPVLDTPECIKGADLYNRLDPIIYEELGLQSVLRNALFYCEVGDSTDFLQRYYNPMLQYRREDPLGGFTVRARDPFTCFPDPSCKSGDIQNDCQFFILAERRPRPFVANLFPDKLEEIKRSGGQTDFDEHLTERQDQDSNLGVDANYVKLVGATTSTAMNSNIWSSKDFDDKEKITIITCFLRGDYTDTTFRFRALDGEGNRQDFNKTVKTRWRQVVYIPGVLLSDGPSRFYDGELPLIRICNAPLPGSIWGLNDNKQMIPLQDLYNELWSWYKINIRKQADPGGVISAANLADQGTIKKWVRGVIKYLVVKGNAGSAVAWDRPQSFGQDFFMALENIPRLMESIKAQPQILQGEKPPGVKSGTALQTLTFNAMPRTSDKTQNFEVGVKETVEKVRLDWFTGQKSVIRRIVGGAPVEIYPKDYLDLAISTIVVPGSSMQNYGQQKIEQIVSLTTALQGVPPQYWPAVLKNTQIPELRDLANDLSAVPPPPVAGQPGQTSPAIPGGATQVPFQIPQDVAI